MKKVRIASMAWVICCILLLSAFKLRPVDGSGENRLPAIAIKTGKPITFVKTPVYDKSCQLGISFELKTKGLEVVFLNTSQGDFTDIEWNFGDGYGSRSDYVAHSYDKPGIYRFSVTLYNGETGCIDMLSGSYYLSDVVKERFISDTDIENDQIINLDY